MSLRAMAFAAFLLSAMAGPVQAAQDPLTTWTESATRDSYNGALGLKWSKLLGDFGTTPLGSVIVTDLDKVQVIRFRVTGTDLALVRTGGTNVIFNSREAANAAVRPALIVNGTRRCQATRDTALNATTAQPLGAQTTLQTTGPILIAFDDCVVTPSDVLTLELTTTATQFGTQTLTAYAPKPAPVYPAAPSVASASLSDMLMKISGADWKNKAALFWMDDRNVIMADKSLWAFVPTGGDTATGAIYLIPKALRAEKMFLRFTMTVAADWWTDTGGKWPGLANTGQAENRAVQAGWGGILADGTGWSARLQRQVHGADPFAAGWLNIQPYVYRVNKVSVNGDGANSAGIFQKNVPVTIDEMVQLNTIAANGTPNADGQVAVWVNGKCVSVMTGIIFRTSTNADTLPSEIWLDTYEGGTGIHAPHPMGISYKEVILSKKLLPYFGSSTLTPFAPR